jgi:hypothetical protein
MIPLTVIPLSRLHCNINFNMKSQFARRGKRGKRGRERKREGEREGVTP